MMCLLLVSVPSVSRALCLECAMRRFCSCVYHAQQDSLGGKTSAISLVEWFEAKSIRWANAETKMTLYNVRLHTRIFKRLSMSVLDESNPKYDQSALFWVDRNEDLWGRKGAQTMLQESGRSFDAFVAAIPDNKDLRNVAETYHVMLLRGYNVKAHGRNSAETAKQILLFSKIPPALIDRYPAHKEFLNPFRSLKTFHENFPTCLDLDGNYLGDKKHQMPILSTESLDKLVTEILIPLLMFKKFSSLNGTNTALGVSFVKEALPDLDQMYKSEEAERHEAHHSSNLGAEAVGTAVTEMPVSAEEAEQLKKDFETTKKQLFKNMAAEHVSNNVVFLKWSDSDLIGKISMQPVVACGASRLWFFNCGTDATKDPPAKQSTMRMKGCADEEHINTMIDITSRMLTDADAGIIVSGRNSLFHRDAKKALNALRPRVGIRDLVMDPSEAEVLQHIRIDMNLIGTVDLRDPYLQFVKSSKLLRSRRGVPRRFVPGNTAFKVMGGLPVLERAAMAKVTFEEREALFRGVVGSDKWRPGCRTKKGSAGDAASSVGAGETKEESEHSESEMEVDEQPPSMVDASAKVVAFHMELHPRVANIITPMPYHPNFKDP